MTDPATTAPSPDTPSADPTSRGPLPPDPVAYDDTRNVHARARGLPAPYISGGTDPDPAKGLQEERYYGRLLVYMVVGLILGGFVIGLVIALAISG